jgi:lipopolysaccharide transport system ATP-binding protein
MVKTVIEVENLSKYYRLGVIGGGTLREDVNRWWANLTSHSANNFKSSSTDDEICQTGNIWALREINLEVKQGEVLGIIGRNGAGKSTLLKILSKITAPTSGRAVINGRVGSLLEVGTGFHPELTGRENIYLNGSILGMSKAEVARKLDGIVEFAEASTHLDTPVKRYSSGMVVRLAFAVAAHLEPEILIVDEVLAVGDLKFQRKCLGKMREVGAQGRTILFVSHNMAAINQLCQRCVLLHNASIISEGDTKKVIGQYAAENTQDAEKVWPSLESAPGDSQLKIMSVRVMSEDAVENIVSINQPVSIEVEFLILQDKTNNLAVAIYIVDSLDNVVLSTFNTNKASSNNDNWYYETHTPGRYVAKCLIPENFFNDIQYKIHVHLVKYNPTSVKASAVHAISFSGIDTGGMREAGVTAAWHGLVRVPLHWETKKLA